MDVKNTFKEYKFPNGETIKLTVAFCYLLKLRENNKKIYEKLNNGILNGVSEMIDAAYVLYGAYLCACYAGENGGKESIMTETDFIAALEDDVMDVMIAGNSLLSKKKN